MRIAILVCVLLAGCTDANRARMFALGSSAEVKCWSGATVIFDGVSTGKVERNEGGSDGYHFVDKADSKLKEVSGNCLVTYQ